MEGVLVAEQQVVEEVGMLVQEHGHLQCLPAPPLVDDHLARLEFGLVARRHAAGLPGARVDGAQLVSVGVGRPAVGPEDRAEPMVRPAVEEEGRVAGRHVVAVDEQHVLEAGVDDGVGLDLPAVEPAGGPAPARAVRVDAAHALDRFEQTPHLAVHLGLAAVPHFDGQPAAERAQRVHQDPRARVV